MICFSCWNCRFLRLKEFSRDFCFAFRSFVPANGSGLIHLGSGGRITFRWCDTIWCNAHPLNAISNAVALQTLIRWKVIIDCIVIWHRDTSVGSDIAKAIQIRKSHFGCLSSLLPPPTRMFDEKMLHVKWLKPLWNFAHWIQGQTITSLAVTYLLMNEIHENCCII